MAGVYIPVLLLFDIGLVKIGLIDVVVFGTNEESIGFFLGELHGIHSNHSLIIVLSILCSHSLIKHIKVDLWIVELSKMPLANLAIIRDTHDVMRIFGTYDSQGINWMMMPIFSHNTFLIGCRLLLDVPLNNVT